LRVDRFAGLVLAGAVTAGSGVSAHRLDEYLQAARIDIAPDRITIELDLTPGVAIAGSLVPEIDRDSDGTITAGEGQAYVRGVLGAIDLALDGGPLEVESGTGAFPDLTALQDGTGTIRLSATVALPPQQEGAHRVFFRNRYRPDVSVYLANALVPETNRISVSAQRHSGEQRELAIDFRVVGDAANETWSWRLGGAALASAALLLCWRPRIPWLRRRSRDASPGPAPDGWTETATSR
jgi:hypothetical protein